MKYLKIVTADIANGEGFRVSLFVSGCARKCKGCFNSESHDPNNGKEFDDKAKYLIYKQLAKPWCKGLSILGGEPLSKLADNRKQVIKFCKEIKEEFPDKDIWLWSGYYKEEIEKDSTMKDILKYIDVLVDGPFEEDKKDLSLTWRGSSNQNVIQISNSRK